MHSYASKKQRAFQVALLIGLALLSWPAHGEGAAITSTVSGANCKAVHMENGFVCYNCIDFTTDTCGNYVQVDATPNAQGFVAPPVEQNFQIVDNGEDPK